MPGGKPVINFTPRMWINLAAWWHTFRWRRGHVHAPLLAAGTCRPLLSRLLLCSLSVRAASLLLCHILSSLSCHVVINNAADVTVAE